MSQFKTQAEIFQALLDGKTLLTANGKIEMKLIDSFLKDRIVGDRQWNDSSLSFSIPEHWSIKKKPMVIWCNVFGNGTVSTHKTKQEAEALIQEYYEKSYINHGGRTVKFIEVEDT